MHIPYPDLTKHVSTREWNLMMFAQYKTAAVYASHEKRHDTARALAQYARDQLAMAMPEAPRHTGSNVVYVDFKEDRRTRDVT